MKKLHISYTLFILFALACFIFSCKQQTQNADVEAGIAAIKETMKNYEATTNAGDFEGFMSLWAEDGVRMPPGAPSKIGKAQIIEELKPVYEQFTLDLKITIDEAKVFGDIGITRCNKIYLALTPKAGGDKIILYQDAKALTIHKKQQDGTWKIIYDCFNSNIPMKQ